ncbi:MAG: MFS transporter [Hyphomicrobiales bacterium]
MTAMQGAAFDDHLARRNAIVLAVAQALYGGCTTAFVVTSGLIGSQLAPQPFLSTLPQSMLIVGTAATTLPLSLLMRRIGRKAGFVGAALVGAAGALGGTFAIYQRNFMVFLFSCLLIGIYQASASYYRFAAADLASPALRPKAISWVMTGGVIAALLGSLMVIATVDLLAPVTFAGTWIAMALLALLGVAVLQFVNIPVSGDAAHGTGRPLAVIASQPTYVVATGVNMIAYAVMMLVMTATPVAMLACGFSVQNSSWVIQWHALAMFVPSFFTGTLITLFGVERIVLAGMAMLALAGVSGVMGITFGNFAIDLVFLGLGWNFGFIGGTTMLTAAYRAEERNKAQGLSDFLVFAATTLASLGAGAFMATSGWGAVNMTIFPLAALGAALTAWQWTKTRRVTDFV